jgi:hypothetical protein
MLDSYALNRRQNLPARSQNGMAALDIFYTELNDVNFYVEDEEQENLYFEILRRLFKSIKIARIFPLGGKSAVLQHATSAAKQSINCFRAYIVDRDLDHLLGKQFEHSNVFYLDRFCVENHLLQHSAIVEIVIENHLKRKRAEVEVDLSLDAELPAFYKSPTSPVYTFPLRRVRRPGGQEHFVAPRSVLRTKTAMEGHRRNLRRRSLPHPRSPPPQTDRSRPPLHRRPGN